LKTIRVLLVDDHQVVREGLKRMLESEKWIEVVGGATSGEEAIDCVRHLSPDIILMDIKMPGMGGIEAVRQIKAIQPSVKVIVVTLYQNEYLAQAAEAGAAGYLLKDTTREELIQAIQRALLGQTPLAPSVTQTLLREYVSLTKLRREQILSQRQIEILRLIAAGLTNKEIGPKLFLSEATVKREIQTILAKLNATDRSQAVSEAYKRKLIELANSEEKG